MSGVAATYDSAVEARKAYVKLKPGPGRSAPEVAEDQRARIQAAMIELASQRGYGEVAVRDLVRVAKVSSRAFYEHFRGKEECFLRTYETAVSRLKKRIVAAQADESDPHEQLRLAFRAFVREIERDPQAAHFVLVEAYAAGPAARARVRDVERAFEVLLAEGLARLDADSSLSPVVVEGIVAGLAEVGRRRLLSLRAAPAPEIADELLEWALSCSDRAKAGHLSPLSFPVGKSLRDPNRSLPDPSSEVTARSRSIEDRDLILAAVLKLAAAKGRARLNMTTIRSAAGVSRQVFDAHFRSVDDCFAAAVGRGVDEAVARAARASDARGQKYAEATVLAFCGELARETELARLCLVETLSAGPESLTVLGRITDGVAALLTTHAPRRHRPGGQPPASVIATGGAISAIVSHRIAARHLDDRDSLLCVAPTLAVFAAVAASGEIENASSKNLDLAPSTRDIG